MYIPFSMQRADNNQYTNTIAQLHGTATTHITVAVVLSSICSFMFHGSSRGNDRHL
jgi:hypothetical protein